MSIPARWMWDYPTKQKMCRCSRVNFVVVGVQVQVRSYWGDHFGKEGRVLESMRPCVRWKWVYDIPIVDERGMVKQRSSVKILLLPASISKWARLIRRNPWFVQVEVEGFERLLRWSIARFLFRILLVFPIVHNLKTTTLSGRIRQRINNHGIVESNVVWFGSILYKTGRNSSSFIKQCLGSNYKFEGLLEKTPTEANAFLMKSEEYKTAMKSAGDARARELLEHVVECLVSFWRLFVLG